MNKLKNLDEILQNLDNSLLCRKNSTNLFAPQMDTNYSTASENSYSIPKHMPSENVSLLSTDGELTFATPPHSHTTMCNLGLNEKPLIHSRQEKNLVVDHSSYSESRSYDNTQIPQSFATPITNREARDVPLLLSKFANFGNAIEEKKQNEEKTIKEVVEMVVEQVGQQMLQKMQCLRRQSRQQVNITMP